MKDTEQDIDKVFNGIMPVQSWDDDGNFFRVMISKSPVSWMKISRDGATVLLQD